MLGIATAALSTGTSRWIERAWGCADIHARQKWTALWPHLERLPRSGIRLLDAGCGSGRWALEIAARRPDWIVTGIDRDGRELDIAESGRRRLELANVSFTLADFLEFQPARSYDVILSVASAHYLAGAGQGDRLFSGFNAWLSSSGLLLLLGPRSAAEVPAVNFLGALPSQWGFSAGDLRGFCSRNGFDVQRISPVVGRLGTLAKQMAVSAGKSAFTRAGAYPVEVALTTFDRWIPCNQRRSAIWLLVASKAVVIP